jgi:hypothetical protein
VEGASQLINFHPTRLHLHLETSVIMLLHLLLEQQYDRRPCCLLMLQNSIPRISHHPLRYQLVLLTTCRYKSNLNISRVMQSHIFSSSHKPECLHYTALRFLTVSCLLTARNNSQIRRIFESVGCLLLNSAEAG